MVAIRSKPLPSRRQKVMVNADGETVPYVPKEGQPSGDRTTRDSISILVMVALLNEPKDSGDKMMRQVRELCRKFTAILMLPFQILIASLSSIIGALLYLKTRSPGESRSVICLNNLKRSTGRAKSGRNGSASA